MGRDRLGKMAFASDIVLIYKWSWNCKSFHVGKVEPVHVIIYEGVVERNEPGLVLSQILPRRAYVTTQLSVNNISGATAVMNSRPATHSGYIDPSRPNPRGPGDADIIIYGYVPSLALAALAVTLFGLATIAHTYQIIRYKTWYFIPIVVGCAMEVVGYIFRIFSNKKDPYAVIYFVIQYFFIVVAPVFFSAAIYTILSYLINAFGRHYSPIPPRVLLILFVICDVIATVVQVAGAALIGSAESSQKNPTTPNNILLAGLAFQVFTFFIFIILLSIFLWRARKVAVTTMMPFTLAFCAAVVLIYLRTCFRLVETAQGLMHSLSNREVFFGCLEFAPVVIAILLFNLFHPGKWVPRYPRAGSSLT